MKSHRYSIEALASKVGMDRSSLSLRLNNRREFTQEDMLRISKVLDIQLDDLVDYFFKNNVEKTPQIIRVKHSTLKIKILNSNITDHGE